MGWLLLRDGSTEPGTNVLGLYRERWFLFNLLLSYAAIWSVVVALYGWPRRRSAEIVGVHVGAVLALVALEATAFLGFVDYSRLVWGNDFDATGNWTPWTSMRADAAALDPRLRRITGANLDLEGRTRADLARRLSLDVPAHSFHFETDAYGFRNPPDKGDAAIYAVGDSQLVGPLLPREALVTERLEAILGVPVMNVSEPGYALQEEIIRLERTGLPLAGRLVVQFISEETDLFDSRDWRQWREAPSKSTWPTSGPTKVLLAALHRGRRTAAPPPFGRFQTRDGELIFYFYPQEEQDADVMHEMPRLEADLLDARARIEAAGGHYALVLVTARFAALEVGTVWPEGSPFLGWKQSDRLFAAAMQAFAEREGIPYHDLTPVLQGMARDGEAPFPFDDSHMTARAHDAVAHDLAPWLRELRDRYSRVP